VSLRVVWPVAEDAQGRPGRRELMVEAHLAPDGGEAWAEAPDGRRVRLAPTLDAELGLLHLDGWPGETDAEAVRITLAAPASPGEPARVLYAPRPRWLGPPVAGGRGDRPAAE
jgi:hypothetical protein